MPEAINARKSKDPRMQGLQWNGTKLRVRRPVPLPAQRIIGKAVLLQSLGHGDLGRAQKEKLTILRQFDNVIEAALKPGAIPQNPVIAEALRIRQLPDARRSKEKVRFLFAELERETRKEKTLLSTDQDHDDFEEISAGNRTPILLHYEDWILSRHLAQRTEKKQRQAIEWLIEWLRVQKLPLNIETIDRRIAAQYNLERFVKLGVGYGVHQPLIFWLKSYWEWLFDFGHYEGENPWMRIRIKAEKLTRQERPRAFRTDEIERLFSSDPTNEEVERYRRSLLPAMAIAAVTGARIGSIYQIRARDVVFDQKHIDELCDEFEIVRGAAPNGVIVWAFQKSAATERISPIHPAIEPLLRQLVSRANSPDSYLLKDGIGKPHKPNRDGRKRGSLATQNFMSFRRDLGVDDRPPGKRQSRVRFHSFRNWAAQQCINSLNDGAKGFNLYTVEKVIGHKTNAPKSETMDYAWQTGLGAFVACVDAIKLPASVFEAVSEFGSNR